MKKILVLLLVATLAGCNDFLDVKPVGARFTTELDAVKSALGAWQYNFSRNAKYIVTGDAPSPWVTYYNANTFFSAVDVWSFSAWNARSTALTATEKQIIDRGSPHGYTWTTLYELVGLMNLVVTEAETANGDQTLRDILMGEAHIQRAYYLFKLLQYYAPVGDAGRGIPVHTNIYAGLDETDLSPRSQSEVYAQIISDLQAAEAIIARTAPSPTFNIMFNKAWIYRVGAQIYHWKASTAAGAAGDWGKAADYASLALKEPGGGNTETLPLNFEDYGTKVLRSAVAADNFGLGFGYPETLGLGWMIALGTPNLPNTWSYDIETWKTLYIDGDKRKTNWFLAAGNFTKPSVDIVEGDLDVTRKFPTVGWMYKPTIFLMRLAEQQLIKVEALAMSGDISGAQAALTAWRSLRYEGSAVLAMPATAEAIRHECYLERKREFLGEGDLQWLDMKRFKVAETREVQDFTATLAVDDFRYQFPIPEEELKNNPGIVANPGWAGLVY